MEQINHQDEKANKTKVKSDKSPVLLNKEASKLLKKLSQKANKKEKGRKITQSQLVFEGLKLISDSHIKKLQSGSLSEKDMLELEHQEYCKNNGKMDFFKWLYKVKSSEKARMDG